MRPRWLAILLLVASGTLALFGLTSYSSPTQNTPLRLQPVLSAPETGDRPANLLVNPSFEGDFYFDPPSSLVAQGWTTWFVKSRPTDHRPEWNEEVLLGGGKVSWRVRHGDKAQKMFSSFSTHEGGFYQQVNVIPGSELEFSIWVQVWSSDCDKNCVSPLEPGVVCPSPNTHGNYRVSVGIDPTGGTDPLAPTVRWREYRLPYDIPYDVWNRLVITATAEAHQVTVFTRGWAEFQVKHNDSYWEDAMLRYLSTPELPHKNHLPLALRNFEATPVATGTPPVTLTPTTTPTATLPPTSTPTPTLTPTVTSTPTYPSPSPTSPAPTPTLTPTAPPACTNIVANPGFEEPEASGEDGGWMFQIDAPHPPEITTERAAEGSRSLRLGVPPDGENREGWSTAWQAITLPPTLDSATLTFLYFPESTDLERDYFEVRLLDAAGFPIRAIVHPWEGRSNAQGWLPVTFDLTPYAGQTVQLYFSVYNDGRNGSARVYLDNVQVEVCGATEGVRLQNIGAQMPRFDRLQAIPFGQVHFTWARYGKRTPNADWTGCVNPTDVEIEWVELRNEGSAVNLAGWTLENSRGEVFTLPHFRLGPGQKLRIWTDRRENGPNDLFMNRSEPFWDDAVDRATLRFPNGELATGSLCWFEAGGFPIACPEENP